MPKYDFTCIKCDRTVEMHFAFDAKPVSENSIAFGLVLNTVKIEFIVCIVY